jgi:hypothetical protein
MEEYEFTARWTHISSPPQKGNRCIVTDGDTIAIGTYVDEDWIVDGMGIASNSPYHVIGWMPVPKPMKKIVPHEDTTPKTVEKN